MKTNEAEIRYSTWYLKLFDDDKRNIILKAFVPINTTFPEFKDIDIRSDIFSKIPGRWIEINELSEQGWQLQQAIPRHTDWVGIFKSCNKVNEEIIIKQDDTDFSIILDKFKETFLEITKNSETKKDNYDVSLALLSFVNNYTALKEMNISNKKIVKTQKEILEWLMTQLK